MSEPFDPYHKWLGVPPNEQPANHYRLLGVVDYESDADVIESAADRQMRHVRSFQSGRHAELSQKLLNELSKARLCLLDPDQKRQYDEKLRTAITPDGRTAVSGSLDETLKVWDLASGRELRTFNGQFHFVECVAITPDGRTVVSGSDDNTLKVWDLASGEYE